MNPVLVEHWYAEMDQILNRRSWLAQRHPQPEPAQVAALNGAALIERIAMLDQLLATAPPDCADLIDGLIAGGRTPGSSTRRSSTRTATSSSP